MEEPYIPKVNDYVIWDKGQYGIDEGWVYFFSEEYITIETGVRPKPPEQLDCGSTNMLDHVKVLIPVITQNVKIKGGLIKCPTNTTID